MVGVERGCGKGGGREVRGCGRVERGSIMSVEDGEV